MRFIVLIVLLILVQVEARLFAKMSMLWGGGGVFLWVLLSAYLGSKLIQYQQQKVLHPQNIMILQQQGRFHPLLLPMAVIRMLAGVLLIIPGFFTDQLAVFMCIPPITAWIAKRFTHQLIAQSINRWMPQQGGGDWANQGDYENHVYDTHSHYDDSEEDEYETDSSHEDVVIKVQGRVVQSEDDDT